MPMTPPNKPVEEMTELEKLDAGLEYNFLGEGIEERMEAAYDACLRLNRIQTTDHAAQEQIMRDLLGSCGKRMFIQPGFFCARGSNIHVGEDFLMNVNLVILDIMPVTIGDYCMIGPDVLITTVGHPLSPQARRDKKAIAAPIVIGDDVWIGGHSTILPGVTIGDNVVVAAGAVVSKDVPSNCIVGGVPARVIRELENDVI